MTKPETNVPEQVAETSAPVCSMTGYARVAGRLNEHLTFTLTLKSINHRFLDLQLRTPAGAEALEAVFRRELKARLARGHIECTLTMERTRAAVARPSTAPRHAPTFHPETLALFLDHFRETARAHALASEPDLNLIAQLPGMLVTPANGAPVAADPQPAGDEGEEQALEREVLARLHDALQQLVQMRAAEGEALVRALREHLARLEAQVTEIARLRAPARDSYYERLRERLQALLGEAGDPKRLLQEAALLAERGDIEEELTRMHAHIAHFHRLLAAGGEVGKKLDFLLQEMHRETNTLLAKTSGTGAHGAEITAAGLAMKAEIEKAREQVQNLE
jgi:uncharacterized protein (TIGR00255 family)